MTGNAFDDFERRGWERAAARYEEYATDTVLFVESLLDAVGVRAGARLLDVACGPGLVSEAAAARGARPLGVDVAAAMLERARQRCPSLEFVGGDAQDLPFPDGSFDAVTMNFGILHLSRPDLAVAEALRVLRHGGRFAFTAWVAENNAAEELLDAALDAHALAVDLPDGPDIYRFADPTECRRVLAEAGFDASSARIETVTALWRVPDADVLFESHLCAGVRVGEVLRAQPPAALAAIRDALAAGVRRHREGDGFALPVAARVVSVDAERVTRS